MALVPTSSIALPFRSSSVLVKTVLLLRASAMAFNNSIIVDMQFSQDRTVLTLMAYYAMALAASSSRIWATISGLLLRCNNNVVDFESFIFDWWTLHILPVLVTLSMAVWMESNLFCVMLTTACLLQLKFDVRRETQSDTVLNPHLCNSTIKTWLKPRGE